MSKINYKNDLYESIHTSMSALYKVGAIDKITMREFDASCLAPTEFAPSDIQRLREVNHLSQPVFARYLGTSDSTVEKWESGAKRPSGMALKLLSILQKHGLGVMG
ncbi:MAG: hypothetical protein RLY97_2197 [Pseudomonadota bacterium]|jgi:putative transcriptional regulator